MNFDVIILTQYQTLLEFSNLNIKKYFASQKHNTLDLASIILVYTVRPFIQMHTKTGISQSENVVSEQAVA